MTLLQVCDPLLVGVCELNRMAKAGILLTLDQVRADMLLRFRDCSSQAAAEGLTRGWSKVEPAMRCFVDSMVENLPIAELKKTWGDHRLADEEPFGIAAGESAFYNDFLLPHLDELQRLRTPELIQIAEVYYACLQLGFEGSYRNKPQQLAQLKSTLAGYLRDLFLATAHDKITPDAYEHTIVKAIDVDSKPAFWGLAILTILFVVTFFVFVGLLYNGATKQLHQSVETILTTTNTVVPGH